MSVPIQLQGQRMLVLQWNSVLVLKLKSNQLQSSQIKGSLTLI